MPEFNVYPHFVADQVLTAKHLNSLFDFLDEQNRLTRNRLIGVGIACGLEPDTDAARVKISKGVGVTSAGYLIPFDGGLYPYYRKNKYVFPDDFAEIKADYGFDYLSWEAYALLDTVKDAATDLEIKSNAAFMADKVVVLLLEKKSSALKNCTNNDCDDKGENVEYTYRPLLVTKKSLEKYKPGAMLSQKAAMPEVYLKRFNVPHKNISSPDQLFKAFYVAATDNELLNNLQDAYKQSYQVFSPFLSEVFPSNPFDSLKSYISEVAQILKQNEDVIFVQYLLDWVDDLIKAYHEFRLVSEDIISECCPDANAFPFHLLLGEIEKDDNNKPPVYRHYFLYSSLLDGYTKGKDEVLFYFRRMVRLVKDFVPPSLKASQKDEIRVTPSRWGQAWLSERAIPYYYKPKPLVQVWNYALSRYKFHSRNLSYNAFAYSESDAVLNPLLYDIERNDFFRVEGHIGKRITDAYESLIEMKQEFNLPFEVVAVNLNASLINDKFIGDAQLMCRYKDLESDYNRSIVLLLEKLHRSVCFATRLPYMARESVKKMKKTDIGLDFSAINKNDCFTHSNTRNKYAQFVYAKQKNGYKKGDFVKEIYIPQANTTGKEYLHLLSIGADIPSPSENALNDMVTAIYQQVFYFLKLIDALLEDLLVPALSKLDYNGFALSMHRFEAAVNAVLKEAVLLIQAQMKADKANPFLSDIEFDVVVDELEKLLDMGIEEEVQSLYFELQKRYNQLLRELTYNFYSKSNTGLEHKAGVPGGGTLVLVYQYEARNEIVGKKRIVENQSTFIENKSDSGNELRMLKISEEIDPSENKTIDFLEEIRSKYGHNLTKAKMEELERMIDELQGDIEKTLKKRSGFNSLVLADFYLPYNCCGGCGSPVYERERSVPKKPEPDKKIVNLSRSVCFAEKLDLKEIIKSGADAGTLDAVDTIISDGGLTIDPASFAIKNSKPDATKEFQIIYASKGVNTVFEVHLSLKIFVTDASFKLGLKLVKANESLLFNFQATNKDAANKYDFAMAFLNDNGTEVDLNDSDVHLVMLNSFEGKIENFNFRNLNALLKQKGIMVKEVRIRIKLTVTGTGKECKSTKSSQVFDMTFQKQHFATLVSTGMQFDIK